jgi:predicted patatin/cPLA2 family phospholipase
MPASNDWIKMTNLPQRISENITAMDFPSIRKEIEHYAAHGSWRPGVRMGVIFEGGALRGVVSAGYGLALSHFIRSDKLFSIYGASSGALNALYFASEHLDVALKIYEENATDPRCTNIWRFPNVLNPDWLVDEWMFGERKFDLQKINAGMPNVWISLTNLDNGRPYYFNAKGADPELLRQAMKATAYAPLVSNGSQVINGTRYGDGAISDAIPYDKAISDGCTHIICLLTREPEYRKRHTPIAKFLETLRLLNHTKKLRAAYFARDLSYSALLDRIYLSSSPQDVPTLIVHPESKADIPGNLETRSKVIAEKGRIAYEKALKALRRAISTERLDCTKI